MRAVRVLLMLWLAGCADGDPPRDDVGQVFVQSSAFFEGGAIPAKHTCDGDDVSPAIFLDFLPKDATHMAFLMEDVDADLTHWLWWDYRPDPGFPEGFDPERNGAVAGKHDLGGTTYAGPCPPDGESHRYVFRVYLLDGPLGLPSGSDRAAFDAALEGRVLGEGALSGRYAR